MWNYSDIGNNTVPRSRALSASLTPRGGESWNGKLGLEAFVENKGVLRHVSGERAVSPLMATSPFLPEVSTPSDKLNLGRETDGQAAAPTDFQFPDTTARSESL